MNLLTRPVGPREFKALFASCAAMALLSMRGLSALVVNTDLGVLANGATNLAGTTVGGPNNANNYANTNPAAFWGSEYVYQFTINARSTISLTSNDPNGAIDNDFFILSSLDTTANGNLNVGASTGDFVEVSGPFGTFDPGTYYLAIDAYAAANSAAPGNAGAFSAVLTVGPPGADPPSTAVVPGQSLTVNLAAGQVIWFSFDHPGGGFGVETLGSALVPTNDTELFLYSSTGSLVGANDDGFGDGYLSRLSAPALPAGRYFLAAAGYNSTGAAAFAVNSTSTESGSLTIGGLQDSGPATPPASTAAVPGGSLTHMLAAGEVKWFSFSHPGGPFAVNTSGSTLAPENDSELFLFTSAGVMMATNDDINANGGDFLSRIDLADLPAGNYYLVAGGYDSIASAGYFASSDSPETGELHVNGLSLPPAAAAYRLAAVSLSGTTLTLRLTGTVGRTYRIEKAVSPGGPWATDGADVTLASPEQALIRTVTPAERRLFHRAAEQP